MDETSDVEGDIPVGVTVERQTRELRIDWMTGPSSLIPWSRFRLACPCAQCQGEFRSQLLDPDEISRSADETELIDVRLMGHYALQPVWKSGHTTGIYPWEYLRGFVDRGPAEVQR